MKTRLLARPDRALAMHLLLALCLLAAQSLAQAHAYSHLRSGSNPTDFTRTAGQQCSECLSSAPLLGTAGCPKAPQITLTPAVAAQVAITAPALVEVSRHYAFRSRAPPARS